jgi:ABC-2 type transport system permease protein
MKSLNIFLYEWKHLSRSPFKMVALLLFIAAAIYGLHNGASLYQEQTAEIERIKEDIEEDRKPYLDYYDQGKTGPEARPWVDISTPFWAIWYNNIYHFKAPSPAMVYSIGQAEQYGFYKRVTFRASPYDSDMTKEIANPERLQTGTLDFTFVLLFLLPLLLLILVYNLKSAEAEQGFLPLIEVQVANKNRWLLSRLAFYTSLLVVVLSGLLFYGALLTHVFASASIAFWQILLHSLLYLLLWSMLYFFILLSGSTIIGNTLKMVGVWLLFAFIVPALVHQWVSMEKPANLMTDFIDATRDQRQELYDQPDSLIQQQLNAMFPEIPGSPASKDSAKTVAARNESTTALVNELMKSSITVIEADNQIKNKLIRNSFVVNPVIFFQNRFNTIAQTHFNDYQQYREEIQVLIDKQIRALVIDTWQEVKVDKEKYMEYIQVLSSLE